MQARPPSKFSRSQGRCSRVGDGFGERISLGVEKVWHASKAAFQIFSLAGALFTGGCSRGRWPGNGNGRGVVFFIGGYGM